MNMAHNKKTTMFGWNVGAETKNVNNHFSYGWSVKSAAETKTTPAFSSQDPVLAKEGSFNCKEIPKEMLRIPIRKSRSETKITQDYKTLRDELYRKGKLFEDPEFAANCSSLTHSGQSDQDYVWLRPKEISKNPQFVVEGYSRFDVRQGTIGNCWFLAAVASLTQNQKYFDQVVPNDNSFNEKYAGIFHFRFWQYGKWVDVVIDDRLPTRYGRLVYMHSVEENEFWSALLEKAYAKLHGSYETLWGGNTCEAMMDFTGGIIEMYEINEIPDDLYEILQKAHYHNSMMSASLLPDPHEYEAATPQGLIKGHAYSITKVQMVDIATPRTTGKIQLLRLRNPWGDSTEWKGPFSDNSPEWKYIPASAKRELGLTFEADGEFWMSFTDFKKYFDRIEMCHLSPDCLAKDSSSKVEKHWKITTHEGEWTKGLSAGGCRNFIDTFWLNPQYVVTLTEPDEGSRDGLCSVVIALMQKHRRTRKAMEILNIGFIIYKVNEQHLKDKPMKKDFFNHNQSFARCPTFINIREVSCRFRFEPGNYLIIPSTYEPHQDGEFLIRIFSQPRNRLEENDHPWGPKEIDIRISVNLPDPKIKTPERTATEKLFLEVAGDDREVDWSDLQSILNHCMCDVMAADGFSKDICRSMVAMLDKDQSGMLGYEEFKKLLTDLATWKAVFRLYVKPGQYTINGYELRDAIGSAGYRLNNKLLNALVHRFGSKEGKIDFDDFVICAIKVKTMMDAFREKDRLNRNQATFTLDEWIEKSVYS